MKKLVFVLSALLISQAQAANFNQAKENSGKKEYCLTSNCVNSKNNDKNSGPDDVDDGSSNKDRGSFDGGGYSYGNSRGGGNFDGGGYEDSGRGNFDGGGYNDNNGL